MYRMYLEWYGPLPTTVKLTGTSGKGSVAAMLEAMLIADGLRVGTFTSPHLYDVTERIRLSGKNISPQALERFETESIAFFRAVQDALGPDRQPSFFEKFLILAFQAFAHHRVDVAIIEAGKGGYFDVVSQLSGAFAAITSVGFDHIDELGSTLEAIAHDKAGIASDHAHLVLGPNIQGEAYQATVS